MPLAEMSEGAFWASVMGGVSVVIAALAAAYVKIAGKRGDVGGKAQAQTNEEYRKLLRTYEQRMARLEKKIEEHDDGMTEIRNVHQREMEECRGREQRLLVQNEGLKIRMETYEAALEQANIPFKRVVLPAAPDGGVT